MAGFTVWWRQGAVLACRNVPLVPVANDGRISVASYPKIQISKCKNFLRNFCINFGWDSAYTHKCHWPAKHQHSNSNQVQSDSLPSVSGDVTSGTQKMLKKGICKRHLVKWQVVPLRKFTFQIFSNVSKTTFFFQETSSFWLLENAKNPTDLKPYWSRAGLHHPYICLFWITICCRLICLFLYMSAWNTNEFVQPATGDKHPVQPTQGRSTLYSWGKNTMSRRPGIATPSPCPRRSGGAQLGDGFSWWLEFGCTML